MNRIRTYGVLLLTLIPSLLLLPTARGHIVPEQPWDPVAAAYLRSLFYTRLKPVPWDSIAAEYEAEVAAFAADPGDAARVSVLDVLADADEAVARGIRQAIDDESAVELYLHSTRAVSRHARRLLARAESLIDRPGVAEPVLERAEGVFRAFFEDGIRTADPAAYRDLGRAWLDLRSSVGAAELLGRPAVAPEPERFAAARAQVDEYLVRNFEDPDFVPEGHLAPVPAEAPEPETAREFFAAWLPPGTNLNDQRPLPMLRLNFETKGIDEADLFLVAYGDMLFDSAPLLGEPAATLGITCSTCHNRSDINRELFIPGLSHQPGSVDVDGEFFNPRFNDRRDDPLNIPSLRGLRFTAPYGRDGRFTSLRDFVRNVIVNEFNGEEPTPLMLDALVTYMLEFDWLPVSHLESDGSLSEDAPEAAKRGESLFRRPMEGMGGRSCATCHVPSANFIDRLPHDIGSAPAGDPGARESFFDTPTLINSLYTAPYFHDGSLPTLRAVVEWFDQNHDLGLSTAEVDDLTAYLEVVGGAEEPYQQFDFDENTPFRLAWEELSTFLSTLETLLPARDRQHTLLLLDTVAPDLRADVVGSRAPMATANAVYEIADTLDAIRVAVADGDWGVAEAHHADYLALVERHDAQLR